VPYMFPPFSLISRVYPNVVACLDENADRQSKRKNLMFLPSSPDSPSVSKTGAAGVPLSSIIVLPGSVYFGSLCSLPDL